MPLQPGFYQLVSANWMHLHNILKAEMGRGIFLRFGRFTAGQQVCRDAGVFCSRIQVSSRQPTGVDGQLWQPLTPLSSVQWPVLWELEGAAMAVVP